MTLGSWLGGIAWDHGIAVIIEGGARGADRMAREFARMKKIKVETYEADWGDMSPPCVARHRPDGSEYNALAGSRRNQRMLDEGKPDLVVAFEGGRGTADMVAKARGAGVRVFEAPKIVEN